MGVVQARLGIQSGGTEEEVECVLRCFEHHGASVGGWAIRGVASTGVMSEFDVCAPTRREMDRAIDELRGSRSILVLWLVDQPAFVETSSSSL